MKKLIIAIMLLICFTGLLHAKSNDIVISQNGIAIGRMTPDQYENLVIGSEQYVELMLAQKENRVTIECDKVVASKIDGLYTTNIKIIWKDKEGRELNYIVANLNLNIDNDKSKGLPEWRIIYRDVAEVGFPIAGGLLVFLLLILL